MTRSAVVFVSYGIACGAASFALGMLWGLPAQFIAVPFFFGGGVVLGRSV